MVRGAMQSGTIGYWIDQAHAGNGYIAEAVVVVMQFAFEQLGLHRVEICIVPRNERSRRIVEKFDVREEGVAQRYLEINGVWEDHIRYGITAEEWTDRRDELMADLGRRRPVTAGEVHRCYRSGPGPHVGPGRTRSGGEAGALGRAASARPARDATGCDASTSWSSSAASCGPRLASLLFAISES